MSFCRRDEGLPALRKLLAGMLHFDPLQRVDALQVAQQLHNLLQAFPTML